MEFDNQKNTGTFTPLSVLLIFNVPSFTVPNSVAVSSSVSDTGSLQGEGRPFAIMEKICTTCGVLKNISEYYVRTSGRHYIRCKRCVLSIQRRKRKIPDKIINLSGEIWKTVVGSEGAYSISNYGRIKSEARVSYSNGGAFFRYEKLISSHKDINGYWRVSILKSKGISPLVHRLVAQAFIPNPDNKPHVNHIDGNPSNCNLSNLEWVTASENMTHAYRVVAPKQNRKIIPRHAKLSPSDIMDIKNKVASGTLQIKVAREYNVTPTTICDIVNDRTWQHLNK